MDDSQSYIEAAESSNQYAMIKSAIEERGFRLTKLSSTHVLGLRNTDIEEEGIRVELNWDVVPSTPGDQKELAEIEGVELQATFHILFVSNNQETVAYLRAERFLLHEFESNDELIKTEQGHIHTDWRGTIVLGAREFEWYWE